MATTTQEADLFDAEARAFRKSRGPVFVAVVANLILSGLLLGVPYQRGREHAHASLAAFAEFSACLLGGRVAQDPGLSLPRGDRESFARKLLTEDQTWPGRCESALLAIAPPDATFVWPSVKRTGGDVRKVVDMLHSELTDLREVVAERDAIPERPLLVLAKLRATLALFAGATSADTALDHDAITFEGRNEPQEPTRLPIMASSTATMQAWLDGSDVQALAADRQGVSWLRLADGKIERRRPRRTGIVRGTLVADKVPYLVWATRELRCAELDDHCAGRALGLTPYDTSSDTLPEPRWFRGHPHVRIDRALRLTGRTLEVLARTDTDNALALHSFDVDAPRTDDRPLAPSATRKLSADGEIVDALLVAGGQGAVLIERAELGYLARWHAADGRSTPLSAIEGEKPWVSACVAPDYTAFAYGSETQLQVTVARDGNLVHAKPVETLLHAPYDETDPGKDAVELHCGAAGPALSFIDRQHQLWALHCRSDGGCEQPTRLSQHAVLKDSILVDNDLVVAYSGGDFAQIKIRVGDQPAYSPGPCFTPRAGICGQPILFGQRDRIILLAHQQTDLVAIESENRARSFIPLKGLSRLDEGSSNQRALRQHRLRKGLN